MRISDWSSDVCSSDLNVQIGDPCHRKASSWPASSASRLRRTPGHSCARIEYTTVSRTCPGITLRSEEHTSELQSLMRISYAVFCLKKKNTHTLATIHKTEQTPQSHI